ncbi:hypothetical protein ACIBO1_22115 [Micromonospora sp. NPDC049903]|uniref:hypothetical protein n=1 Tax=Micromonospora sp. NPDC049903 TaxID=3364276 RepID=UPI0037997EC3
MLIDGLLFGGPLTGGALICGLLLGGPPVNGLFVWTALVGGEGGPLAGAPLTGASLGGAPSGFASEAGDAVSAERRARAASSANSGPICWTRTVGRVHCGPPGEPFPSGVACPSGDVCPSGRLCPSGDLSLSDGPGPTGVLGSDEPPARAESSASPDTPDDADDAGSGATAPGSVGAADPPDGAESASSGVEASGAGGIRRRLVSSSASTGARRAVGAADGAG